MRETYTDGFEQMPHAFIDMLQGGNTGKAIVRVWVVHLRKLNCNQNLEINYSKLEKPDMFVSIHFPRHSIPPHRTRVILWVTQRANNTSLEGQSTQSAFSWFSQEKSSVINLRFFSWYRTLGVCNKTCGCPRRKNSIQKNSTNFDVKRNLFVDYVHDTFIVVYTIVQGLK